MRRRLGPAPAPPGGPASAAEQTLWLVVSATYIVSLSGNTLGVAVPVVVRHFHASAFAATLVVLTPSLTSTAVMLGLGRVGDLLGRRACYLAGLSIFTLASLLLGAAPDVWVVVALQVLQACGVATVWANSAAILLEELPPDRFQRGLGLYIAAIAVAELMGPTLGGIVAETIGWRWIFWLNVPAGALCALWAWLRLPTRTALGGRLDTVAPFLSAVGLAGLVLSISVVESTGRVSVLVVAGIVASLAVLAIFVGRERHKGGTLLDVALFRERSFSLAMAAGLFNAMAEWGPVLLMVLFFQAVRGDSPLRAGLIVVPLPILMGVLSASAGRLAKQMSSDMLSILGSLVAAVGLAALVFALSAPYFTIAVALGIVGAGGGIFMPANANALMSRASASSAGGVNGVRLSVQNVGWVTSTAIVLTVAVSDLPAGLRHEFFAGTVSEVSRAATHELLVGYRFAVGLLALFALAGAVSAVAARSAARVPVET